MKHLINFFAGICVTILAIAVYSCQSDEPGYTQVNYGQMRISRMNLTGAKQLALKAGSSGSRTIYGEYLSAGLYKIDANGNISAVCVYFTTDSLGNRLEQEYALKVAPAQLCQITENYAIAVFCEYYDADGDIVQDKWIQEDETDDVRWIKQDVPYKHLLVRLSDGKIWCVDNIADKFMTNSDDSWLSHDVWGCFKQDKRGVLYLNGVYKFNLSSDEASLEQIIPDTGNVLYYDYHIADNGVIWSLSDVLYGDLTLNWPKVGYQTISSSDVEQIYPKDYHYYDQYGEEVSKDESWRYYHRKLSDYIFWVNIDENPGVIVLGTYIANSPIKEIFEYLDDDIARYYDVYIGDTPGSAILDNPIILGKANGRAIQTYEFGIGLSYDDYAQGNIYVGSDFILCVEEINDIQSRISKIDLTKRDWTILKTVDFKVYFNYDQNIDQTQYADRIWSLSNDPFGIYWFDLNTLEDGFVPFNVTIPDWMHRNPYTYKVSNGYVAYSGTNPDNYNYEEIVIDITTGEAVSNVVAPEYAFETLINLN